MHIYHGSLKTNMVYWYCTNIVWYQHNKKESFADSTPIINTQ